MYISPSFATPQPPPVWQPVRKPRKKMQRGADSTSSQASSATCTVCTVRHWQLGWPHIAGGISTLSHSFSVTALAHMTNGSSLAPDELPAPLLLESFADSPSLVTVVD